MEALVADHDGGGEGRRAGHQRDQPVSGEYEPHVHRRRGDGRHDRRRAVDVVALEAIDDAAEDACRKGDRHVNADDEQKRACGRDLFGGKIQHVLDIQSDTSEGRVRNHADDREDDEQRTDDFVEAVRVPARPVERDELRDRAAEAEIEHREVHADRCGQHPQAVRRRSEVVHVEGQDQQTDQPVDDDGEIAGGDIAHHPRENLIVGAPDLVLGNVAHWAPFPNRITLTVSSTMVRSKTIERCLM